MRRPPRATRSAGRRREEHGLGSRPAGPAASSAASEDALGELGGGLFEPTVRLGVTGLSRAGKTVFITSLVANLLDRGRMPQLRAAAEGRIQAAYLQPQPDHTIPRFAYEDHLAALTAPEPHWPESTRSISTLRLSLRIAPTGLFSGLERPAGRPSRHRRLPGRMAARPAADEPGLRRLVRSATIAAARTPARAPHASAFLALLDATDAARPLDEPTARALAAAFTAYLAAARAAGLSSVAPGRFLMPGDLEGSPALTFSALPRPSAATAPRSGAPSTAASRPTSASSSTRSSATTSPASTARSCWSTRSAPSTTARAPSRTCAPR